MCDCVKQINQQLKDKNLRLEEWLMLNEKMTNLSACIPIHTTFVDESKKKRGDKAIPIFPSHCPFCGEKIKENEPEKTHG